MHRKIAAAVAALVLFAGPSTVSFAQNPSGTPTGTNPTAEGIGNTSSTHNPRPQSSGPTGMENRKATGGDMGTDTSTHNPSETAGPMSVRFERTSGFRFVQNAVNLYESDKIVDMAPCGRWR